MCIYKCMLNVYKNQQNRQTGSRNLMGPKMLPMIWGTYMKLVTKYQISAINSCWEKCDEKCAYMFNVYKNQLSRQKGSRNLTGPKTLPTIWYTYMTLVTKYHISAINSYWVKCDEKYLGQMEGRTEVKQYIPLPFIVTEKAVSRPSCLWFSATVVLVSPTFSSLVTLNVTYFKHLSKLFTTYKLSWKSGKKVVVPSSLSDKQTFTTSVLFVLKSDSSARSR